ncbi:MAG: dihydroorotate dehydrogenase-like protein [Rikenellaceae bacterium]
MKGLKCSFVGLELTNPIIAASCGRTNSAKKNLALEMAGVGAIVLKSLFEEDIIRASAAMNDSSMHSEAADYLHGYLRSEALSEYITLIKESKAACSVPIIASINCHSDGEWENFASLIEEAGADALQLNIMDVQSQPNYTEGSFEQLHLEIAKTITSKIQIPVIVKLCSNITNPISLISKLYSCGVKGVTLFNRMYQSDIDIEKMQISKGAILSSAQELALPLRFTSLASAAVPQMDYSLSGGVQNGADVVKAILSGATTVEVCSSLYREGNEWIGSAVEFARDWQQRHGYKDTESYRGTMNAKSEAMRESAVRTQFLKFFGTYQ